MAVAAHLGIDICEYDARIRTFIPDYETMIAESAQALVLAGRPVRHIVDLGTGTGALAARCLASARGATLVAIDVDEDILALARRRLPRKRTRFVAGDFSGVDLPACDAMTASFALHHVPTLAQKRSLYRRAHAALRPGGLLVSADCCLATNVSAVARDRMAWRDHLADTYGRRAAEAFLRAWAHEDYYQTLEDELAMLRRAGFAPDVLWRRGSFAVVAAIKPKVLRS